MAITNASRLADFGSGIGTAGAVLKIDNSSNEVGIGTTNPNATLTVGNIGASGTSIYVHGDGRITGVLTATSFSGDGSNLSGISTSAVPGISTQLHSVFGTINVSGISTFTDDVKIITDSKKLKFGAGSDLELYHDGSNSYIADVGTGELRIRGTTVRITDNDGSENFANFIDNGAVELYCDNAKKFETTGAGVIVTGICTATSFAGDGSSLTGTVNTGKAIAMAMIFG